LNSSVSVVDLNYLEKKIQTLTMCQQYKLYKQWDVYWYKRASE